MTTMNRSVVQPVGGPPLCPITIARVRSLMRNVDEAMYQPDHVSIGPYHHKIDMDLDKTKCLNAVLSSVASDGAAQEALCSQLVQALVSLEVEVKKCYANSFPKIGSTKFARMLLLDGCYLLVMFNMIGGSSSSGHVEGSTLLEEARSSSILDTLALVRDVLYLAENQIPFFVLDKILQTTASDSSVYAVDKIMPYVKELLKKHQYSVASAPAQHRPGNLLHLLHMHLKPINPPSHTAGDEVPGKRTTLSRWRTATEYYFVGVTFKPRPLVDGGEVQSILDVNTDSGTLEIPPLDIDAETLRILHNLMALEQHNPKEAGSHVTAYCVFMSQVACTAADVDLLSSKGVITHTLGNNGEVADRFADLCKGIVFDLDDPKSNYLRATCQELEERFRSRVRRWMAWLVRNYFDNPWLFIGLMAAAVGLTCSVVQSVYAVLSYK